MKGTTRFPGLGTWMEHVRSQSAEHLSHTRTLQDTWDTVVVALPPRSRISQFLTHSTPAQNITQQQQEQQEHQQNAVKVLGHAKFHKNEISFAAVCVSFVFNLLEQLI